MKIYKNRINRILCIILIFISFLIVYCVSVFPISASNLNERKNLFYVSSNIIYFLGLSIYIFNQIINLMLSSFFDIYGMSKHKKLSEIIKTAFFVCSIIFYITQFIGYDDSIVISIFTICSTYAFEIDRVIISSERIFFLNSKSYMIGKIKYIKKSINNTITIVDEEDREYYIQYCSNQVLNVIKNLDPSMLRE